MLTEQEATAGHWLGSKSHNLCLVGCVLAMMHPSENQPTQAQAGRGSSQTLQAFRLPTPDSSTTRSLLGLTSQALPTELHQAGWKTLPELTT